MVPVGLQTRWKACAWGVVIGYATKSSKEIISGIMMRFIVQANHPTRRNLTRELAERVRNPAPFKKYWSVQTNAPGLFA